MSDKENRTVRSCFFQEDILTDKKGIIWLTKVLSPLGFYRLNSFRERNAKLTKQLSFAVSCGVYSSPQTSNPCIGLSKKKKKKTLRAVSNTRKKQTNKQNSKTEKDDIKQIIAHIRSLVKMQSLLLDLFVSFSMWTPSFNRKIRPLPSALENGHCAVNIKGADFGRTK